MVTFCGLCVCDIPTGSPEHFLDGVRLCESCATDEIVSVDNRQGYTGGDGGIGRAFREELSAKHDEIVPDAVVTLDRQIECLPKRERHGADDSYMDLSLNQRRYIERRVKGARNRGLRKDSL